MDAKPIAILLIIITILNLVFFAFGKISQLWFWAIIILTAFMAYKVLPKLKKN